MSQFLTQEGDQVRNNLTSGESGLVGARFVFWGLIILAVLLALVNSFRNPLFESPDEQLHYQFVRYLIDEQALPVQPLVGSQLTQYHQPPLYYFLGAIATAFIEDDSSLPVPNNHWTSYRAFDLHRDNKAQFLPTSNYAFPYTGTALVVHSLRLFSVGLFAGTLVISWLLGRDLWPNDIGKQILLLAIVALNPMLLYIGSSVNNDGLIVFLGSLLLLLSMVAIRNEFKWSTTLLIGIVWGFAILSKLSGLLLVVPWGVALLWVSWRKKEWRLFVSRALAILGLVFLTTGWWFARNVRLYQELTAVERMLEIWGERQPGEFGLAQLRDSMSYGWSSFWGRFGYGQIVLPTAVYWLYTILVGIGLIGLLWQLIKMIQTRSWDRIRGKELVLAATALIYIAGLFYFFSRNPSGANGRYTFPAISAFAALVVVGLSAFRWSRQLQTAYVALFAVLALLSIGLLIPWTYAPPNLITEEAALAMVTNQHELYWGDSIRLLGSTVEPRELTIGPESEATITACWKAETEMARDYTFFVHLLDPDLNPIGQRNMHPGLGNFPTSLWEPGNVFCDTYVVPLAESGLIEPTIANVEIGFFDSSPQERLPATTASSQLLDFVVIDQIKVIPLEPATAPEPPNRLNNAQFDQAVTLAGYDWSADALAPGQTVTLTLWWSAEGPLDTDYSVFTHLIDDRGQLISQSDGPPRNGHYPTNMWGKEIILDEHSFNLPADSVTGSTQLELGFYRVVDGVRLPRSVDAELPDTVIIPGPIVIE